MRTFFSLLLLFFSASVFAGGASGSWPNCPYKRFQTDEGVSCEFAALYQTDCISFTDAFDSHRSDISESPIITFLNDVFTINSSSTSGCPSVYIYFGFLGSEFPIDFSCTSNFIDALMYMGYVLQFCMGLLSVRIALT